MYKRFVGYITPSLHHQIWYDSHVEYVISSPSHKMNYYDCLDLIPPILLFPHWQTQGHLAKGIKTSIAQGRSIEIISIINWILTSKSSIKKSLPLSLQMAVLCKGREDVFLVRLGLRYGDEGKGLKSYLAYKKPPPRRTLP